MSNVLVPFARNFEGTRVLCDFTATADGVPITLSGDPPVFFIPAGTRKLSVTAKPVKPPKLGKAPFWEHTVTMSLSASGVPTADPDSVTRSKLDTATKDGTQVTILTIGVSRFREVTADMVDLLKQPPTERYAPRWDATWTVDEVKEHRKNFGSWPPSDWELGPVSAVHFIDPVTPVSAGLLNVSPDTVSPDVHSVVLRLAGAPAPQLFAVVWPKTIVFKAGADPTPFLLFVRQGARQSMDWEGIFKGPGIPPHPDNFDYADTGLFQNIHYGSKSQLEWGVGKGVPYQIAKAGAEAVTVVPANAVGPEFGVMSDTEETGRILGELQGFMFWRAGIAKPPTTLGKTAIAAFSSGNNFLRDWLMVKKNRDGGFLKDVVTAVYFLDPPLKQIESCAKWALEWAGKGSDKRIRFYTQTLTPMHEKVLGSPLPKAPFVTNSADDRRSVGIIPFTVWSDTAKKKGFKAVEWWNAHHMMAATLLTHALHWKDI
jgi:hypothetical protein